MDANYSYDYGTVQISTDEGQTWTSVGNRIQDYSGGWSLNSIDLTAYAGQQVRIAFTHVEDPAYESAGWYIDEVTIERFVPAFGDGSFETGWGDWYADRGVWQVGAPTAGPGGCHSGSQCAGTVLDGNYPSYTDSRLISPTLTLPAVSGAEEIHLRFWQWFAYYPYGRYDSYDYGTVQISTDDGQTWTSVGNRIQDYSGGWSLNSIDLTAYAGQQVRIAFTHVEDPAYESAGWYIDEVTIERFVPAFGDGSFETGWGDWYADRGVWQVGAPTAGPGGCYAGSQCAGTVLDGNYPSYTDSRLISPTLTLPAVSGAEEIHLRFWQWFAYYPYGRYDSYDYGTVQISTDAGQTWTSVGNRIQDYSGGWSLNSIDLTAYAGQQVRIAFTHVEDPAYESAGWYIDDIEVLKKVPICTPPILEPIGNIQVEPGELLTFTVTASDPDGGELTLTASNLPDGATFVDNGDGTGQFSWQTSIEDEGVYSAIIFTASNSCASDSEEITITVGDVNQPPVLDPIGDHSLEAGELFTLDLSASDPDEDELTFTATDLPTGAAFTDNGDGTASFSWTPDAELAGNFVVTFIVTDDGSPALSDSEEVTLTVGDVNRPPVLDPIGNQVIGSGEELTLLLTATDPDGDDLTYEASGIPTGAIFIDNKNGTAEFTWTPDEELTGNFWMTFKVTDDGEPVESDSESLHISVGHMNRPPVMGPVGNHGIEPGEPFHFALHASDPEGDALRFIVAGLPEDAGFVDNEDGSAEFSWTPTEDDVRNYKLLFRVIDTAEPMASDWEEVTFTVGDINRPPMLAPIGNRTVDIDEQISLVLTCRDPDGDKPSYEAIDLPEGADLTDNQNGTALFTWVAADGSGRQPCHDLHRH